MPRMIGNSITQKIGSPMKGFQLADLERKQITLQMILAGKKGAVVVFWSGMCSHCARYDNYLNSFGQRYAEIGLVVVASRPPETLAQLRATCATRQLRFPILKDAAGQLAKRWFTQQTPRVFLLDANCVLLYRGAIDNFKCPGDPEFVPYLDIALEEFLAQRPITRSEIASFGCAIQSIYYDFPKAL